jgi:hypothetical protein
MRPGMRILNGSLKEKPDGQVPDLNAIVGLK